MLVNNSKLKKLVLEKNGINEKDCSEIKSILLNNQHLETLDLNENNIGNEGLKKICDGLKATKTIKILGLFNTEISQLDCLREVLLNNSQLEILNLNCNDEIKNEGMKMICDGLNATKTIKEFSVYCN